MRLTMRQVSTMTACGLSWPSSGHLQGSLPHSTQRTPGRNACCRRRVLHRGPRASWGVKLGAGSAAGECLGVHLWSKRGSLVPILRAHNAGRYSLPKPFQQNTAYDCLQGLQLQLLLMQ